MVPETAEQKLKKFRNEANALLEYLLDARSQTQEYQVGRNISLAITDLESSIMRAGRALKEMGAVKPYEGADAEHPHSD